MSDPLRIRRIRPIPFPTAAGRVVAWTSIVSFPLVVVLCVFGVLCLTPLALYLTWLGALNRRPRPTPVGGRWDFAALIAGLSGFILFGGGLLVGALQSNARLALRWNEKQFQSAFEQERPAWAVTAGGYLLVVAGGVVLGMVSRSRMLSVYNIDREAAEAAVDAALADAGTPGTRFGDVWTAGGRAVVEIKSFHGFRHATLRLLYPEKRLGEEIMRGLHKRLAETPGADGPAAGVLLSLSIGCLLTMLGCLGLIAYFLYLVH